MLWHQNKPCFFLSSAQWGEVFAPFTLHTFTLRHKMTDSVLSISGCFVWLGVSAVLLAAPNSGTERQHLKELAGSLPLPVGFSSLPQSHLGEESVGKASWRE